MPPGADRRDQYFTGNVRGDAGGDQQAFREAGCALKRCGENPAGGHPPGADHQGDAKSVSIAAASIVAKVTRDRLMEEYDKVLPGYGFASNKGYGSAEHIAALKEIGPSPIHRQSFIGHFV